MAELFPARNLAADDVAQVIDGNQRIGVGRIGNEGQRIGGYERLVHAEVVGPRGYDFALLVRHLAGGHDAAHAVHEEKTEGRVFVYVEHMVVGFYVLLAKSIQYFFDNRLEGFIHSGIYVVGEAPVVAQIGRRAGDDEQQGNQEKGM